MQCERQTHTRLDVLFVSDKTLQYVCIYIYIHTQIHTRLERKREILPARQWNVVMVGAAAGLSGGGESTE